MDIRSKEEYLMILAEELKYLKKNDLKAVLDYYNNKISTSIDYGEKEIDVISKMPDPSKIAEEQYENHGVRYLEQRKKEIKRKETFSRILSAILLVFITIAELFSIYILIRFSINILKLAIMIFKAHSYGYLIAGIGIIFYFISVLFILLYILDLFIMLWSHFFIKVFNLKEETKDKLSNLSINYFIDSKLNKKKFTLKLLIGSVIITLIFLITSGISKGYVYKSINNLVDNYETIELGDISNISIKGYDVNININKGDNNSINYGYELSNDKDINVVDNKLNINLNPSYTFDLLNILNEPTQRIDITLKEENIKELNIEILSGSITIVGQTIENIHLKSESKCEFVISESNINNIDISSTKLYFGITSSNIDTLKVEATSGQEIIEKDSHVKDINLKVNGSIVKYSNSKVESLNLNVISGTTIMENMNIGTYILNSTSSRNSVNSTIIEESNISLYLTSYYECNEYLSKKLEINANSSYILLDYFKSNNSLINGDNSYLFLTNLKKNKDNEDYNNYNEDLVLTSTINGNMSKTEIGDSIIDDGRITQVGGYLLISNTELLESNVTITKCKGVEYNDVDGNEMELYISGLTEEFSLKSTSPKNIHMIIKKCDTLSFAYINNKGNYNLELSTEE